MQPRSTVNLGVVLAIIALTACSSHKPSIVGKWSGWMTVACPNGKPPTPNYRQLTISLDLTADGQCTNVHGSGIGADITSHDTYVKMDSLLLVTNLWGTDTLNIASHTDSELVLRRAPYENGCQHFFTMTRQASLE
ncbi:MAG: hypothetical protein WAU70_08580 [Flavobacteriales bacterium]